MDIKKILTNNKILVRIIISYILTSILLTSLLLVIISSLVSTRIKKQTTDAAQDLLRQSYNTAEYILTDIYGDFYTLWSKNESINRVLNLNEPNQEDIQEVCNIIDREIFKNDFIDSIYVFNKNSDIIVSNLVENSSIAKFYDTDGIKLINDFEDNYEIFKNEIFFPRKTNYIFYSVEYNKNYISIVYSSKDDTGKLASGLIVNIDQNKLSSLFNTSRNTGNIIIVNSSGKIISDLNGENFGEDLPRNDLYNKIAYSSNIEDSFVANYNGTKSYVTYKKAENIGFVFISLTPYWLLQNEVRNTNRYIGFFFVLSMIISLTINLISTKKIYEPLNKLIKEMKEYPSIDAHDLIDEYSFLGRAYDNLLLKDKQSHVYRIFNGNSNDQSLEILGYEVQDKFITFAMIIDEEIDYKSNLQQEIVDIVNGINKWNCAITSQNCISCIINDNDFNDRKIESLMDNFIYLQSLISDKLDTTVSIGLGTIVNGIDSIKFSHRYAIIAAQYAKEKGENQVVYYNEIEDNKVAASLNKDNIADKIKDYIDNNFTRQDFAVDEISNELELSIGYLRQIFKSEKDITINEYIINCRIDLAKDLLISTDKTAKEIANEIGYYDNRYFYTLFKKKTGMTTDDYRTSHRKGMLNEN